VKEQTAKYLRDKGGGAGGGGGVDQIQGEIWLGMFIAEHSDRLQDRRSRGGKKKKSIKTAAHTARKGANLIQSSREILQTVVFNAGGGKLEGGGTAKGGGQDNAKIEGRPWVQWSICGELAGTHEKGQKKPKKKKVRTLHDPTHGAERF